LFYREFLTPCKAQKVAGRRMPYRSDSASNLKQPWLIPVHELMISAGKPLTAAASSPRYTGRELPTAPTVMIRWQYPGVELDPVISDRQNSLTGLKVGRPAENAQGIGRSQLFAEIRERCTKSMDYARSSQFE